MELSICYYIAYNITIIIAFVIALKYIKKQR